MGSDIVSGAIFPDYELADHTAKRRKLLELQGQCPMVQVLGRGSFCPKDRPQAEGLVELHLVLEPSPVIYKIYDGYWFFGGPTLGDLRQDLGAVTKKCRPDWDITTPELRAAWRSSFVSIKSAADRYQSIMDALPWVAHPHAMECRQERTAMENELSRLVNALPGLVWTALPDGLFDFLNERWLKYTGHSAIRTPAAMNAQQVMRNL